MSLLRKVVPNLLVTSEELGRATLIAARSGAPKRILEIRDIVALVRKGSYSG